MWPFLIPPPLRQPHSIFGGIIIIIIIMACTRSQKQTMKQLKQSSSISSQHSSLQSETYTSQGQLAIKVISSLFVSAVHLWSNDILVTYDKVHSSLSLLLGTSFCCFFSPMGNLCLFPLGKLATTAACVCVYMFTCMCVRAHTSISCVRLCVCASMNYVDLCFPWLYAPPPPTPHPPHSLHPPSCSS